MKKTAYVVVGLAVVPILAILLLTTRIQWSTITLRIPEILTIAFVAIALNGLHKAPPDNYYELRWFGGRTGRIISEDGKGGIYPWIPDVLGGSLQSAPLTPQTIESLEVQFLTKDTFGDDDAGGSRKNKKRLKAAAYCYLQYVADPKLKDPSGLNTFLGLSADAIRKNIEASLEAKTSTFGANVGSTDLIEKKQAIEDFMRCSLQLGVPPHKRHDMYECGVPNCELPTEVPAEDLLAFYKSHWESVGREIREEKNNPNDRSGIEKQNGIDITSFRLRKTCFSKETEQALDLEEQEAARARAAEAQLEFAVKAKNRVGVSSETAADWSRSSVGGVPTTIRVIRSDGPVFSIDGGGPLAQALGSDGGGKKRNRKGGG